MILKILFKRIEQKMNLENGKGFPLPPFSFSQRPSASMRPTQRKPSSRAPPPSSLQRLTAWSRAPVSLPGGSTCRTRLPPRVREGHEPSETTARVFARAIPSPPDSAPLNTCPAAPQSPNSTQRQPPRQSSPKSPPRSKPQPSRHRSAFQPP